MFLDAIRWHKGRLGHCVLLLHFLAICSFCCGLWYHCACGYLATALAWRQIGSFLNTWLVTLCRYVFYGFWLSVSGCLLLFRESFVKRLIGKVIVPRKLLLLSCMLAHRLGLTTGEVRIISYKFGDSNFNLVDLNMKMCFRTGYRGRSLRIVMYRVFRVSKRYN